MPLSDRPAHCTIDHELRFLSISERMLQVLGRTQQELLGRSYLDVYPEAVGSELHQLLEQAKRSFAPQKGRIWSRPLQVHLDVEVYPLGQTLQVAFTPVEPGGA